MNDLSVATSLATAPSSAFAELRERPRFWLPLLAIVVTSAFVIGWYYSVVDIDWLKELIFGNNPDVQKMAPEQRAQAMAFVGRNTMLFGSLFGVLIGVPIVYLISALYYFIVAKITKVPLGFKHWFTLVSWSALPGLLSTIAAVIFLILRDNNQIAPGVLQPPDGAQKFVVVSTAGPHGTSALWKSSDGSVFSRESILLRGMVWEQDEAIHFGANGQPDRITIRGVTPTGDAAETFAVNDREARWKTPVDSGEKAYDNRALYLPYGGTMSALAVLAEKLNAAPGRKLPLLPAGEARLEKLTSLVVGDGPGRHQAHAQRALRVH